MFASLPCHEAQRLTHRDFPISQQWYCSFTLVGNNMVARPSKFMGLNFVSAVSLLFFYPSWSERCSGSCKLHVLNFGRELWQSYLWYPWAIVACGKWVIEQYDSCAFYFVRNLRQNAHNFRKAECACDRCWQGWKSRCLFDFWDRPSWSLSSPAFEKASASSIDSENDASSIFEKAIMLGVWLSRIRGAVSLRFLRK